MTILVTGGAGFIGSNLLHHLIKNVDEEIVCIDKLTYAVDGNNVPDGMKFYAKTQAKNFSLNIEKLNNLNFKPSILIDDGILQLCLK